MDTTTLAILGFAALLILLFLRMSVGAAMLLVGAVGIWMIRPAASLPVVAEASPPLRWPIQLCAAS